MKRLTLMKTDIGRRSFLKKSTLAGGGLLLSFNWLASCKMSPKEVSALPKELATLNGYLKIGDNGSVTIMSPNPEGGQGVKTAMPMIVADELDVDWKNVIVEQAPLNTALYKRQFIGGSQAIRQSWNGLRTAGASARQMLKEAAAKAWKVSVAEISTAGGTLYHQASNKSASYGEFASAAAKLPVPEKVALKKIDEFTIIGTPQKNVDGQKIVTGKPLFGIDTYEVGMLTAMIVHPPAFGMKLKSMDTASVKSMPGIVDVFPIKLFDDDYTRQRFDTCAFLEVVAIVGNSTWEVIQAKKAISIAWQPFISYSEEKQAKRGPNQTFTVPAGLESTETHRRLMSEMSAKQSEIVRKDGEPEAAFRKAVKVIERTYTAPFLAHNCMEPMNFFANVKIDSAQLSGPLQKAELTELTLADRLGIPVEKIDIKMTRLGGGYGRRSYANWAVEAALISQKINAPVKLVYTREDDMTGGVYRPTYRVSYKAALDAKNNLTAIHINAGGIPESPLRADRFPAGAIENYLAESWTVDTNITIGSFRAPSSNFMASAEQSFLDELAEVMGKDPIDFRLELLKRTKTNPVGEKNDYDADRYADVLKLVKEKSNWQATDTNVHRGVAAYFCHNTYTAQVLEMTLENGKPVIQKVTCALDCGIVVNPEGAKNMAEGGIVDGIGNALFGELTFKDGVPQKSNFDSYRMIRMSEAPKKIVVHFVKSTIDPTGLGEPTFPPIFAALANAMYRATGKRYYKQPFLSKEWDFIG